MVVSGQLVYNMSKTISVSDFKHIKKIVSEIEILTDLIEDIKQNFKSNIYKHLDFSLLTNDDVIRTKLDNSVYDFTNHVIDCYESEIDKRLKLLNEKYGIKFGDINEKNIN